MAKKREKPLKKAEKDASLGEVVSFGTPRELLHGYRIVFLARNRKPARSARTVHAFKIITPQGRAIRGESFPKGMELSPVEWAENRARAIIKPRFESQVRDELARFADEFESLKERLIAAKTVKRARELKAQRKELLARFKRLTGFAMDQTEAKSRVIRSEDKLSYLEEKRVSFNRHTYRHVLIELPRDEVRARIILHEHVKRIFNVISTLYRKDPKRFKIFDFAVLGVIYESADKDMIERGFPAKRIYVQDLDTLKEAVYALKDKIIHDFFERAPRSEKARQLSSKAYFMGRYQDKLVYLSGFSVDIVSKPRKARLSKKEKYLLELGAEEAVKVLRRERNNKKRQEKKTRGKKKAKPKKQETRKKRGRVPAEHQTIKTERNPRRG